jgi:hypothetical protein
MADPLDPSPDGGVVAGLAAPAGDAAQLVLGRVLVPVRAVGETQGPPAGVLRGSDLFEVQRIDAALHPASMVNDHARQDGAPELDL